MLLFWRHWELFFIMCLVYHLIFRMLHILHIFKVFKTILLIDCFKICKIFILVLFRSRSVVWVSILLSIVYVAILSLICINTVIGVYGAVRYGNEIEGSISLNLPKDETLSITSQLLMSAALVLTIGLVFQYFMGTLWNHLEHKILERNHSIS